MLALLFFNMKIVIIGSGNVATVLGRKLFLAGHTIVQIFARNPTRATILAAELNATSCSTWNAINKTADFYLVALADNALEELSNHLLLNHQLIAHTAGAVSKEVLLGISSNYGVFYPLQSLRKEMKETPPISIIIEGSNKKAVQQLQNLAKSIASPVEELEEQQRLQLHLAAVFVSNFVNHLYVQAEKYCTTHQLNFKKLLPLIIETANRLQTYTPTSVQTGPAARFDTVTIEKHLALLQPETQLLNWYQLFTKSIQQQ
jgi:predicted short-subunit dehydrogenase-like oxidoreductase (DUF2520 family)